jgi:hypothetical protein
MCVHVVHGSIVLPLSCITVLRMSTALVFQMAVLGSAYCFNVFIPSDGG